MASVRSLGEGKWQVRAYLGENAAGRQIRKAKTVTARNRTQALARAVAWENELKQSGRSEFKAHTVAEVVDRWLDDAALKGRAPRTMHSYRRLGADIVEHLGARNVDQLTVADVEGFYRALVKRGTKVSHHHAALRSALGVARKHGWVARNVAVDASRPTELARRSDPPTVDDVRRLLEHASLRSPVTFRLITVAVMTGMRRGELAAMRRSRVDMVGWTYKVDASAWAIRASEGVHLKDTKTHADRRLPLSEIEATAIVQQVEWVEARARHGQVGLAGDPFLWSPAVDCSAPPHPDWLTREFIAVRRAAGVSARFHDLRHAMATLMLDMQTPMATVSRRLGHRTTHTTASIYAHGVAASERDAAAVLGRAFAGELEA